MDEFAQRRCSGLPVVLLYPSASVDDMGIVTYDMFTLLESPGKLDTRSDKWWESISNPLASFCEMSSSGL
jgi:hypothetical protein